MGVTLLSLFLLEWGLLPNSIFIKGIIIFILIIPPYLKINALSQKEEHSKKLIGDLIIDTNYLSWNKLTINWDEIEKISISFFDYEGKFIYTGRGNYGNTKSNGIDNEIYVRLNDTSEYKGNFLISSEQNLAKIREVLWAVVKENNISYQNAKNMVNPGNYEQHQKLKKLCY